MQKEINRYEVHIGKYNKNIELLLIFLEQVYFFLIKKEDGCVFLLKYDFFF
jgi:hypothetical protein